MKTSAYVKELQAQSVEQLQAQLVDAKKELFNLRFQNATNQLDNTARIKEVRKNIARIQTVITAKAAEQFILSERRFQTVEERNLRKTRVGVVVSDKIDKTIVVAVRDNVRHPLYNKIVKKTYKLKAHDEKNDAKIGDTVRVMETRPLSKDKRWRLVEIMERAK